MLGVRCLGTAVIFQTCISSAKLARGYPGNMPNLYFRFANLYLYLWGHMLLLLIHISLLNAVCVNLSDWYI